MQEISDRYFDDWTEGEVFETDSHLMTEERIRSFAEEFDPQPFHVDPEAAAGSIYGGIIASGWGAGLRSPVVQSGSRCAGGVVECLGRCRV